ncbi:MAG: choice-of-anchor B family protein [Deltaproteobacteria bacterium]|nr:choice-of-anchor B family protein [Deltaproteobacteria bacterium]MBW2444513.1 choice-of-anchor B family protein [Deltaproteobacteria bacterium]
MAERRLGATAGWAFLGAAILVWVVLSPPAPAHEVDPPPDGSPTGDAALSHVACVDGFADVFPCANMELEAFIPLSTFGAASLNDVWGWQDPITAVEYALVGADTGTVFVDVSDPHAPVLIGELPAHTAASPWRDIRVYADHAFIVSEASGHGMQVFDLSRLRTVATPPVVFTEDGHYAGFSDAHNVSIDITTGYAYVVGASSCSQGITMVDVSIPTSPALAGCFGDDGFVHDVQCVVYQGPDGDYQGREICFSSNGLAFTIVDVTDKSNPVMLSRSTYPGLEYVHQGWITEDHSHFFHNDELDEFNVGVTTRTFLWELSDLEAPAFQGFHDHGTTVIDHNLFVLGDHLFQAHYRGGVRVNRFGSLASPSLSEVAYLDTDPASDAATFSGVWGVYPYLPSGLVLATDIYGGLFLLHPDVYAVPVCADGLDNDGDGLADYGQDPGCRDALAQTESPPCQDGVDNDGDGGIDWDGAPADPQCTNPWSGERPAAACGLGFEAALLLPLLAAWRARRTPRRTPA